MCSPAFVALDADPCGPMDELNSVGSGSHRLTSGSTTSHQILLHHRPVHFRHLTEVDPLSNLLRVLVLQSKWLQQQLMSENCGPLDDAAQHTKSHSLFYTYTFFSKILLALS